VRDDRVRVAVADHVAVVTLNRPEKHNALDLPMFDEVSRAAQGLASTRGVRAVVIHGAGKSFCSGIDVGALMTAAGDEERLDAVLQAPVPNRFQRAAYDWITLPVPVIASIHGNCLGAGLQIALAADIRIAAADATLGVMEARWGLIPDMAITRTLPQLVGADVAKELIYTARMLTGTEAASLGLVTRTADDPLAAANELAAAIANHSPDAVRAAKRLMDESRPEAAERALALEAAYQRQLIGSPNQLAAAAAAVTGEPPEFTDAVREL
jgi:enoyl-CoA hydratase/carnithine racemase